MPKPFFFFWRAWERAFLQPLYLKKIRASQNLPTELLRRLKDRRLFEILRHAAATVPYYREYFAKTLPPSNPDAVWDALKKMPILEKKSIQLEPRRFTSTTASLRGTIRWPTSGSSGIPLSVVTGPGETAHSQALVRYAFLESGARPGQKILKIRNMDPSFHGIKKYPEDIFRWYRFDLKNNLEETVRAINELRPEIIYSFPSYLWLLSQYLRDHRLKAEPPRHLFTYGEVLTPTVRDQISRVFDCPVRDTYGTAEFHRIAYECAEKKFHVIESSVIVEPMPDSGSYDGPRQEGDEILLTSLYHKTMPLLRYRIGDRAVFLKGPCRCGKLGLVIEKILGRSDDLLTLPSGRRISARAVNTLDEIPGVMEYQIVQKKPDLFEVLVRPMSSFGPDQEKQIEEAILKGCRGEAVRVETKKVADIKRTSIGKLKAVVSEVKP